MIYKSEEEMKEKLQNDMENAKRNVIRDKRMLFFKRLITIIVVFSIALGFILLRNKYGAIELKSSSFTLYGIEFENVFIPNTQ